MKKNLSLLFAAAAFAANVANAQPLAESTLLDNWYVGVNGGVNVKTVKGPVERGVNPSAGLRVGRWFTPVVGFALEGEAYFNNKGSQCRPLGTFVKGVNASLLGTTNFTNLFGGFRENRRFEVMAVYGLGWGRMFGTASAPKADKNVLTSKLGIDLAYSFGSRNRWQIYVEPNITYGLNAYSGEVKYNINNSAVGVLVGINYKFANSNGTHGFKTARLRDVAEIDRLNARINELQAENNTKENTIGRNNQTISHLQQQLEAARQQKPATVVVKENKNVLQPTVIFQQGRSTIDAAQYASISMIASYMKNHPDAKILIKGYASPEGSKEINQRISEARANAVKNALVKRYKVAANRLTVEGMGATSELFDEVDFNRVVTFTDTTK